MQLTNRRPNRRTLLKSAGVIAAAGAINSRWSIAHAATPVQVISHRYPALEIFADNLKKAANGVDVNVQLMPFAKAQELSQIALSAKSSALDALYVTDASYRQFAKNGWLRPLNDLWQKYKAEYGFDDYIDNVVKAFTYEGSIYCIPYAALGLIFFYREDLLQKAGARPPETIDDYLALAKKLNSPMRSGTVSCLKPVAELLTEAGWYLNALADGWLDKDFRPLFNNEKAVAAISKLKEATAYAQSGFVTAGNDECMIALQQDAAAMGPQWSSRAKAMDDPAKSIVAGKFQWARLPNGGHGRISLDGYAISAFSKHDPDMLFRMIAKASDEASMRGAASAMVPSRKSILADPKIIAVNRHYPASVGALETGYTDPPVPEWYAAGELIAARVAQAVTGQRPVKEALNEAARETEAFLTGKGYFR